MAAKTAETQGKGSVSEKKSSGETSQKQCPQKTVETQGEGSAFYLLVVQPPVPVVVDRPRRRPAAGRGIAYPPERFLSLY